VYGGSSDWLRVYPFEEHLLHLHGARCQQAQSAVQHALLPTPTQWHPFSDERGEGEFTGQLCVTLNGGTRQALDRGLEDNTGQHQSDDSAQARKGACVEPATARENVVVQVFSEHVAPNRQQKFCTVGACGVPSSGRAGRRINQRQVSSLTHWTAQRGRETLAQDILPQAHSIYHVLYPYYIDVREYY
jgi:hypothetical protein